MGNSPPGIPVCQRAWQKGGSTLRVYLNAQKAWQKGGKMRDYLLEFFKQYNYPMAARLAIGQALEHIAADSG